jgi:hypothetical protein
VRAGVVIVLAALAVGCAGPSGSPPSGGPSVTAPAGSGTPVPVRTIVRNRRVLPAGRSADVTAQHGIAVRLTVSKPSVSRTRLSSSYGYPPAHGYYVTFDITIVNTGVQTVALGPANFFVRTSRQSHVTSYDGNSPYSGASRQLDQTQIDPGQRVRAPLTFDVSVRHGRLAFAPDRTPAVVWTY